MLKTTLPRALGTAVALLTVSRAVAIDAGPVAIHGSVSTTVAYSDEYNYLGDTEGSPDLNVIEVILNGSHRFESGLRLSVQLYAYELEGYNDLALDFASLDYSFHESFGVRAGRIKRPFGLHGDAQDIDIVRPFAFLPLDFYPKGLRPLVAAVDGAAVYGTLGLGAAGSLDYQLYAGWLPPLAAESSYVIGVTENSLHRITETDTETTYGGAAFWNTPLEGLRAGFSASLSQDVYLAGPMKTAAALALAPGDARLTPGQFGGFWDFLMVGQTGSLFGDSDRYAASIEYTRGDWQFSAEYQLTQNDFLVTYPAPIGSRRAESEADTYYAMVTWQANDRLQLGAYYAEGFANKDDHDGAAIVSVPKHTAYQKDAAFAAAFALADWWVLKGEVHLINGTRGVTATSNGDAATWTDSRWTYFVVKSTISF